MRLASDYDALDVANKVSSTILSSVAVSLVFCCRLVSSKPELHLSHNFCFIIIIKIGGKEMRWHTIK